MAGWTRRARTRWRWRSTAMISCLRPRPSGAGGLPRRRPRLRGRSLAEEAEQGGREVRGLFARRGVPAEWEPNDLRVWHQTRVLPRVGGRDDAVLLAPEDEQGHAQ